MEDEKNMVTPEILYPAQRQYCHNDGTGFVMGFDNDVTVKIVESLQQQLSERKVYHSDSVTKCQLLESQLADRDKLIGECRDFLLDPMLPLEKHPDITRYNVYARNTLLTKLPGGKD